MIEMKASIIIGLIVAVIYFAGYYLISNDWISALTGAIVLSVVFSLMQLKIKKKKKKKR
ncbi:MAG: hypothetical protein ABH821_00555 [archaeon]